jgi:hypothetical protein
MVGMWAQGMGVVPVGTEAVGSLISQHMVEVVFWGRRTTNLVQLLSRV